MSKVLVIDDHPVFRAGLCITLRQMDRELRPQEAATLSDALDLVGRQRFDLIVYDWKLPGGGGLRGLMALLQLAAGVPVVVMSAADDESVALAARQVGARRFLAKSSSAEVIRAVVADVLGIGDRPVRPKDRCKGSTVAAAVRLDSLTRRQQDVLALVSLGYPNKRIASELGIADATVRAHVSEILAHLAVKNRTQAARMVAGGSA